MNNRLTLPVVALLLMFHSATYAQNEPSSAELHDEFKQAVEEGCPTSYEDVFSVIPSVGDNVLPSSISAFWGGNGVSASDDENAFITRYQLNNGNPTPTEVNAVMADAAAILFECNTHRLALLQHMMTVNTLDATASLEAASGIVGAFDLTSGRWETGDVRTTGRSTPQAGWLFLDGRTIGATDSTADHRDDRFEDLFNLIKTWDTAFNDKTWGGTGQVGVIALPDMRGRAVFGATAMGGNAAPTLNSSAVNESTAATVGGVFGQANQTITVAKMPSHNHASNDAGGHNHSASYTPHHVHSMNNSPSHSHPMGYAGTHKHNSKQALYGAGNYGAGTFSNKWPTGGIRPTSDGGNSATLTNAVLASGNHKHSIGSGGIHKHAIHGAGGHDHSISAAAGHNHSLQNTGGGEALDNTPGMTFNVEIKY